MCEESGQSGNTSTLAFSTLPLHSWVGHSKMMFEKYKEVCQHFQSCGQFFLQKHSYHAFDEYFSLKIDIPLHWNSHSVFKSIRKRFWWKLPFESPVNQHIYNVLNLGLTHLWWKLHNFTIKKWLFKTQKIVILELAIFGKEIFKLEFWVCTIMILAKFRWV